MASQIFARGQARVDVADTLVVGDEIDAVADPAWRRNVAVEVKQSVKSAFTCRVNIEIPRCAATIALPERWLAGITAKHDRAMWPKSNGPRRSVRQRGCRPTGRRNLVEGDHTARWLTSRAGVYDRRAVRAPTCYGCSNTVIGQPLRISAIGGYDIDLAWSLRESGKRDQATIW